MATTWVLMAVPSTEYALFKQMVDDRQRERGEPLAPPIAELRSSQLAAEAAERAALDAHQPWPEDALRRFAAATTATTERFTRLMDICADKPGQWMSSEEVAEALGITLNEWRAACRKLPPHLTKHYSDAPHRTDGAVERPMVFLSGRDRGVRDQLYVTLTAEQAKRWRAVRASA